MLKKAITFSSLLLLSSAVFSQTVDQLKKDNKKLKSEVESKKLEINDLKAKVELCSLIEKNKNIEVRSFADFYDVKVIKCKGNKTEQSVTLELLITQNRVNQNFVYCLYKFNNQEFAGYDDLGNKYPVTKMYNSNYEDCGCNLLTNIPMKFTVKFANILPGLGNFKSVLLSLDTQNFATRDMQVKGNVVINNLPIEW